MISANDTDNTHYLTVLRGIAGKIQRGPALGTFRDDKPQPSLDRETVLKNAPVKENGYFKISGRVHL